MTQPLELPALVALAPLSARGRAAERRGLLSAIRVLAATALGLCALAAPVAAQAQTALPADPTATSAGGAMLPRGRLGLSLRSADPERRRLPWVELHGLFRFRPDWISNGHLGQAVGSALPQYPVVTASAIKPPLSRWPQNNDASNGFRSKVGASREEDSVAGATIRLRLQPTIHVHDKVRLRLTLDAFDNHTLGSQPDYSGALARPDVPLSAFAMSTRPGSIRVVEAFGEWATPYGTLRIGRQASHWGLGILANGGMGTTWDGIHPLPHYYGGPLGPAAGTGYDADFSNFTDRAAFVTGFGGVYLALFWDWIAQGGLSQDPTRFDGVPFDMEDADDVNQWGFALFRKPLTPEEMVRRKRDLNQRRIGVLDFGVYGIVRTQELDSEPVKGAATPADLDLSDAGAIKLLPREAWAVAADAWARFELRPNPSMRFVAEGEFVYLHGEIADAAVVGDAASQKPKSLRMWGGALKSAWQMDNITVGLDAGVASGDDTRCFGVYGPGNCGLETANSGSNRVISGFKFHRNYRVDSLLFRDVIGAVTNAMYVKPTFGLTRRPWFDNDERMGFDLGVLHALAQNADGTPGKGGTLGTEMELRAFLGSRDLYLATVTFSYLIPGDGLNVRGPDAGPHPWLGATASVPAENAWRLMGRMTLAF